MLPRGMKNISEIRTRGSNLPLYIASQWFQHLIKHNRHTTDWLPQTITVFSGDCITGMKMGRKKFWWQNMKYILLYDRLVLVVPWTFFSYFAPFIEGFLHSVEEGTAVRRVFLWWVHHLPFWYRYTLFIHDEVVPFLFLHILCDKSQSSICEKSYMLTQNILHIAELH